MAGTNAQIVRDALDVWRERDYERLPELIAPTAELRPLRAQLERTSYVGPEGARQAAEDLQRDWEDLEFDADEIHEEGPSVLVIGRLTARARGSGAGVDTRIGWLWRVEGGRITFGAAYSDPDEAAERADISGVTRDNVAAVRRHYGAFNEGEVDGILATLHPEIEIYSGDERAAGATGRRRGPDEARAFFAEIKELVPDSSVEVLMLETTRDRVVASVRLHGTLPGADEPGSIPAVHFLSVRDDLISRIESYRPNWRSAIA